MDDVSNILEIRGISKSFGETSVIRNLSFSVARGEFLTVLGSSGCGKTTLLRIICGLEEADAGQVILDGRDVTAAEPNLREVNTVFQSYALFPHMTVFDNVAYPLRIAKSKISKAELVRRVSEALELVRMTGYERRYPSALSGGQKQRIAIARALLYDPTILILDDSTSAVDMETEHEIQKHLRTAMKDRTTFIIAHRISSVKNADCILVLDKGEIVERGTHKELLEKKGVYWQMVQDQTASFADTMAV
jgi:spermidine/putrescine transport system ATP-binding protein